MPYLQLLLEKFSKYEQSALAEKSRKEKELKEKQEFLKRQLESEKRRKEEGASIEEVTEEQAKQIEKEIEDVSGTWVIIACSCDGIFRTRCIENI